MMISSIREIRGSFSSSPACFDSVSRTKQTGLIGDAECDAAALAVRVKAPDSGDVPEQFADAYANAEAGRSVRFGSERGVSASAVPSVDFADQRKSAVELIGAGQAEKRHVVLCERAYISRGVN